MNQLLFFSVMSLHFQQNEAEPGPGFSALVKSPLEPSAPTAAASCTDGLLGSKLLQNIGIFSMISG